MKLIGIVSMIAKVISSLMAGFIIFMFVGETFGPAQDPGKKKGIIGPVRVGNTIALPEPIKSGKWTTSTASVATVDVNGVVTGLHTGQAVVTYSTGTSVYNYKVAVAPTLLHDGVMLGLMGLLTLAMLMVWKWERAGAWLTLVTLTTLIVAVGWLNQIPMARIGWFAAAGIPAVLLLWCNGRRHKSMPGAKLAS